MALVDKQQRSSSKLRTVFIDCQSGHHSHASLINTLMKVYNNVSVKMHYCYMCHFHSTILVAEHTATVAMSIY